MFRYLLSWRYLVRRRTNLIAIVGLFLAVGALIMILSIMTGFLEESRRIVRGSLSDVVITPIFLRHMSGAAVRDSPDELLAALHQDDRVRAAALRLSYFGILNRPGFVGRSGKGDSSGGILARTGSATLAGVQLVGVDVRTGEKRAAEPGSVLDEYDVTELHAAIAGVPRNGVRVEDPLFPFRMPPDLPADGPPGAIVGEQLFSALELERGDVIEVLTALPHQSDGGGVEERTGRFTVVGTFRFGQNEADLSRIYLARSDLYDLLGGARSYTEVSVLLHDYERDAEMFCAEMSATLEERGLILGSERMPEVRTWETYRAPLLGSIENQRSIMAILLSLVLIVAGFTVFAILSMMVNEKRRDIGILSALGATPRAVVSMFLWIAAWDVFLGATAGAVVGTWGAIEIDSIEAWLSSVLGFPILDRSLYLFDTIPSRVEPSAVALILVVTLAATLLAALIPAWRASRLDPLQAVRQD